MKILFISSSNGKQNSRLNDYMHDIVLHGLREIYGNSVIDYPGVWYMYRDEVKKRNMILAIFGAKGLHSIIYYQIINKLIGQI